MKTLKRLTHFILTSQKKHEREKYKKLKISQKLFIIKKLPCWK